MTCYQSATDEALFTLFQHPKYIEQTTSRYIS